ncbi:MAG: hypothetical protein ACSHWU_11485 [Marinicella sp.]
MKFILKAITTVAVVVALLLGYLFFYTGGMTRVADDYFEAITAGESNQASTLLSDYVVVDADSINDYLVSHGMHNVQSSSWDSRHFVNNKGSISGEVINGNGTKIPTRVDFFKEAGDWKIYAIEHLNPLASTKRTEPSVQQQENLVIHSMSYFMEAAKNKSMKIFHHHISKFWQSQITVAELDQAFASIYNFKGDHSIFSKIKPTIESGMIDENNLLLITGYFPMNATRITINQKYIYEATSWRLISFSYSTEQVDGGKG